MSGYFARNASTCFGPKHGMHAAVVPATTKLWLVRSRRRHFHLSARRADSTQPFDLAECPSLWPCCGPGVDRERTARAWCALKAQSSTAVALDDVQTMPTMPSAKRFQVGCGVDVGDWRDVGRVRSLRPVLPSSFRPGRWRPCRPSSNQRPYRAALR